MNALTAVRSFARPVYCPVKHVRIFDNRYDVARMQNVETDPRCDYVGLAEGEYTELMPGNKARERRDSRLNHCNGIAEWTGPVYCVTVYQFNRPRQWPEYAGNHTEVEAIVQRNNAEADKHFRGFQHDIDYYANQTPESMEERAKITGIGSAFLGIPAYWQGQATKDHENAARMAVQLARERAEYAAGSWRTEVEKVRSTMSIRRPEEVKEWRARMREVAGKVAKLSDAERAEMAARAPVTTCEGHALSTYNQVFLAFQSAMSLTLVAGFRQWLKAGRSVRAGEQRAGYYLRPHDGKGQERRAGRQSRTRHIVPMA